VQPPLNSSLNQAIKAQPAVFERLDFLEGNRQALLKSCQPPSKKVERQHAFLRALWGIKFPGSGSPNALLNHIKEVIQTEGEYTITLKPDTEYVDVMMLILGLKDRRNWEAQQWI
jgi:hypothetical protein